MKELYWKIRAYLFWNYIVPQQWKNFNISKSKFDSSASAPNFSIGIVTYVARYERFFKPLIKQLTTIFPEVEIVVMINGYYDADAQNKYIETVSNFLNHYPNVKYTIHHAPQGLSKLWNKLIINSTNRNVFIFNDDITISPLLRDELFELKKETVTLINNSWSHFLITRKVIDEVGWFDERLMGVGNEDQDYDFRLLSKNIFPKVADINKIKNIVEQTKDFSYGKNMAIINNKYTAGNWEFIVQKWNMSAEKKEGYLFSEKFQVWFNPTPNLETPNFQHIHS